MIVSSACDTNPAETFFERITTGYETLASLASIQWAGENPANFDRNLSFVKIVTMSIEPS